MLTSQPNPSDNVRRLPVTRGSTVAIASRMGLTDAPGSRHLRLVSITRPEDIQPAPREIHPDPDGFGLTW